MLTPEQRAESRRICDLLKVHRPLTYVTSGFQQTIRSKNGTTICRCGFYSPGVFLAHASEALPEALDMIDALEKELRRVRR